MKTFNNFYNDLITLENIFNAWFEFRKGKRKKADVLNFERNLEDNFFEIYYDLKNKIYRHQNYTTFNICDPKFRIINKACVKDRVVHHLVYKKLYEIFDPLFISNAYSSRLGKGTHKAVKDLEMALRKVSKNYSKQVFALKCDIKKFFDNIDHNILLDILKKIIKDSDFFWLVWEIIQSFEKEKQKGIPLGNVTSQIFANIYMNETDQFIKKTLRIKYYFRYADDFICLACNKNILEKLIKEIAGFLRDKLSFTLNLNKLEIRKLSQGINFCGYVMLPRHKLLRTKTKQRMFKKIDKKIEDFKNNEISLFSFNQTYQSYLGILKHCNSFGIRKMIGKKMKI